MVTQIGEAQATATQAAFFEGEAAANARWGVLLDNRDAVISSLEAERRHALLSMGAMLEALIPAGHVHRLRLPETRSNMY